MRATVIVRKADTIDDEFSYQFTVEQPGSLIFPSDGDYVDVGINTSQRVVQPDFRYDHNNGESRALSNSVR